ncbi:MAG: hypothetical protein AAB638_02485, partial [Patescibacteria group bacterium]
STAVLILENGDPSIVVVNYDTYKKLLQDAPEESKKGSDTFTPPLPTGSPAPAELELLERINKDILALKEQIEEDEKSLNL